MASIVLRMDERIIKNGMSPIRIRVSHNHTAAWYSTGVYLEPTMFQTESIYDPVNKKAYMAVEKREQLATMVRRWDNGILELERTVGSMKFSSMTATELRDHVYGKVQQTIQQVSTARDINSRPNDFMDWFDKYGQLRSSERTREHFSYVWRLLYQYAHARGMNKLLFRDINYERLIDLKAWIRNSGRGEATRFKVESYIRAAYREGIRMGLCERSADPFLDYRIERVPEHDIITISRDEMHQLFSVKFSSNNQRLQRAKDILLTSFFLCGANFIDIYNMKAPMKNEVSFVRSKVSRRTQKTTRIRVEPELAEILKQYGGSDKMMNLSAGFRSLQTRMDGLYRELSHVLGFKVNLEIIRRTWATLAGELECPEVVIDKSMGHISRSITGRYYEQYDWSRTAKWNRKVIDYIKLPILPDR